MQDIDWHLFQRLQDKLSEAERKHPRFAEGVYEGLGRIGEEYGELCQSVNHGEVDTRIRGEAWDLLVVAWRFVRRDWEQKGGVL